jgi:hypothetical protein
MDTKTKLTNARRIREGWTFNKALGLFFKAPMPKARPTPQAAPRAVYKNREVAFA